MDMRFFGLRDRVRQHQFVVEHIPGQYNIADFFTKALPKQNMISFTAILSSMLNFRKENKLKE